MKYGTKTRAAAFLVYEYKNVRNLGTIISVNDDNEMRYFVFEDKFNQGQTINIVFNDINMIIFNNAYNSVEDLSAEWRAFNLKQNRSYKKHLEALVELQKNHMPKKGKEIALEDFLIIAPQ